MKKISSTLLAGLLAAGCASTVKAPSKSDRLKSIVESHFEEYLKLYPLYATSIGDTRYDDRLTIPLSEAHRVKERALIEDSLAKVTALGCEGLEGQDTLTCEAFKEDLAIGREYLNVSFEHLLPFDQLDSFFSEFAELASGESIVAFKTPKDYDNFLSRIEVIPAYFDQMIANMKEGVKKGLTTPQPLVRKALKQVQDLLVKDVKRSVFYKSVAKMPEDWPVADRKRIAEAYEGAIRDQVYPAYKKLEAYVRTSYLPKARKTHGLSALKGGRELYRALIKLHTTTDQAPEAIMKTGLEEVRRIRDEFEKVKLELGFKGTLKEFFKSLRKDPKLYPFKTSEEVLNAYRAIEGRIQAKIPDLFKRTPKAGFEIREVAKFKAANASEAYQNPTADGSRPGIFWVPVPDAAKYGSKSMESLFLHEAIPGHHFQIAIQQELTDLPRFRRFGGNNAYVEGWALYAESLGKKLGVYTDPYQWVGRLENDMHRAIRLVVDTGIHWNGWTREKAIAFSMENEPGDEAGIVSEIERYMVIPGQALSYKVGELKLHELRERARVAFKERFDIREYHDQILKDGALPLGILERKIDRWIEAKK